MLATLICSATAHLRRDRASRLIACLGVSVVACLALLGGYLIHDLRDGAWRRAERNAQDLLSLIEEGVGRNVRVYDLCLQAAAEGAARDDIAALAPDLQRAVLFDRAATASGLGTINLIDASGQVRVTSDPAIRSVSRAADLPEFRAHAAGRHLGLLITGPRPSEMTGRPIMALSRRIDNRDGSFGGIISGAIELSYFQSLFGRLNIDEGTFVNIVHRDGVLMLRQPVIDGHVGRSIVKDPSYRRFRETQHGLFVETSTLSDKERLYAFANLDGLPLIVSVGIGTDSIRATWLSKAVGIAVLIVGLSGVTLGLTLVLHREVSRRAAAEAAAYATNTELSRLARTDSLTGLPNRRHYDEAFARAWERAARTGTPIALLLLDADHFKLFNDRFGHHRGDEVLQAVAGCMRAYGEPLGGTACRVGGEEFAVILPGLTASETRRCAERIRRSVVDLQIPHAAEIGGVATISIGAAHRTVQPGDAAHGLFAEADAALYEAKSRGRNRVRITAQPDVPAIAAARRA